MTREEVVKEVCERLNACRFGGFISDTFDNILLNYNKAFKNAFNININVSSVAYNKESISVNFYEFGSKSIYFESKKNKYVHNKSEILMTDKQFQSVIDILNQLCDERESQIRGTMKSKPIEEYYDKIKEIADRELSSTEYTAEFEKGKRAVDEDYYVSLVLRNKYKTYEGMIVFRRTDLGEYLMTLVTPLGMTNGCKFKIDDMEKELVRRINYLTN